MYADYKNFLELIFRRFLGQNISQILRWGQNKTLTFKWRILKSGPPYVGGDYPLLVSTTIFWADQVPTMEG